MSSGTSTDLSPLWTATAVLLVTGFVAWYAHEEGMTHNPQLAIDAYEREEHYREDMLLPVVEFAEAALAVVEAHDSALAHRIRRLTPVDVRAILAEEDR